MTVRTKSDCFRRKGAELLWQEAGSEGEKKVFHAAGDSGVVMCVVSLANV